MQQKSIVCLGGGIGTVNLILGLKQYTHAITVVASMADDGGSAGRLRRLYNVLPLGDLVSCMAAMVNNSNSYTSDLLRYRFSGERYGNDNELGGHKLGNLILVALRDITGSYESAIDLFKKFFTIDGTFLPASKNPVTISARTTDGKEIHGEETIDLGKYKGERILDMVYVNPPNPQIGKDVVEGIQNADAVILGPGDLYTNLLPVLIIPGIADSMVNTNAKRFFVVNVANKPFETKGYTVEDYIAAVTRHVNNFPFDLVFINNNYEKEIPMQYSYTYVKKRAKVSKKSYKLVEDNFVDANFPLYHDSEKLAKAIWKHI